MYGSIAVVRDDQHERITHAAAARLAHEAAAAHPAPLRTRRRRAVTHPVRSVVHRWLVAGQH